MSSVLLGIETSGMQGQIALCRDGALMAERSLEQAGRRHAQTLIAEVQELLQAHHLQPADVSEIAVSIGPGSFTGLRVGVVFAKTFAFATGCRLIPVDTLAAVAAAVPEDVTEVTALADAQRDEFFVGHYIRQSSGCWSRQAPITIEPGVSCLARLNERTEPTFAITGPGLVRWRDELPNRVRVLPPDLWSPRAVQVAQQAAFQERVLSSADIEQLEPFYLRASAAEEKRQLSR